MPGEGRNVCEPQKSVWWLRQVIAGSLKRRLGLEGEVLVRNVCAPNKRLVSGQDQFCVLSSVRQTVRQSVSQSVQCRQTMVIVQDYHEERLCNNSDEVHSVYLTAYVNHFTPALPTL